jgi:peptidoglycan/LPS O-acetylase OafA/YrhL
MERKGQRFYILEAGRGIAALIVVFRHSCVWAFEGPHPLFFLPSPSALAVVYFFVVSGVVMGLSHPPASPSWRLAGIFLLRRALRIYPLYWCAMAVALWSWPFFYRADLIWSWIFLTPGLDGPVAILDILPPAWTLHWEVFFYLVFAICLVVPGRLYVLLAWTLAMLAFRPLFGLPYPHSWLQQSALVLTSPLGLFFVSGLAVAWAVRNQRVGLRGGYALLAAGGCVVAYWAWRLDFGVFMPSTLAGNGLCAVGMAGVTAGLITLEAHGRLAVGRWCLILGKLSYPLYISHWMFLWEVRRSFWFLHIDLAKHDISYAAASFAGCVVGGIAVAYLVDAPMQRCFKWLQQLRWTEPQAKPIS